MCRKIQTVYIFLCIRPDYFVCRHRLNTRFVGYIFDIFRDKSFGTLMVSVAVSKAAAVAVESSSTQGSSFLYIISSKTSQCRKIPISEWPTCTHLRCYACGGRIKTIPIPMINSQIDYDRKTIYICSEEREDHDHEPGKKFFYPVFCSINCLRGFIETSHLANKHVLLHNTVILQQFWRSHFMFLDPQCSIETRSRELLKKFGGPLTMTEYRAGFCRFRSDRVKPTTIQQLESKESVKDVIFWPNIKPFVQLSDPTTKTTDDPSERVVVERVADHTMTAGSTGVVAEHENVAQHPTIRLVSDVISQTVDVETVHAVSSRLQALSLGGNRSMEVDSKKAVAASASAASATLSPTKTPKRQVSKRRKMWVPSPPKTVHHPLFGNKFRTSSAEK